LTGVPLRSLGALHRASKIILNSGRFYVFSTLHQFFMRHFLLLGILALVLQLSRPVSAADHGQNSGDAQFAPLQLFTTGSGKVVPFNDGQMLEVGHRYVLTAVAEPGYEFANWNPVNVFTFIQQVLDESGNLETVTNTVLSPVQRFISRPALMFEMQAEEVILSSPALTIIQGVGWQANFVAVQKDDLNPRVSAALQTETVSGE
jgi:hypothetical protein